MNTILDVKAIEKYYGSKGNITKAVDNISFQVNEGEFVGVMGPSGSGKTTLLNVISTIDHVTSGHILINGRDITTLKKNSLSRFRREELDQAFFFSAKPGLFVPYLDPLQLDLSLRDA